MTTHDFTLILTADELTGDQCNALYDAGCDDGTISTSQGVSRVDFSREAATLEDAIRSAIADVNAAGLQVATVEIEANTLVMQ
jgi:hypothetical protein